MAERKNRLLHVAYELFCEHGIDAVTLFQIAEKSAVSHNSIYRYFNSKATLVRHTQIILWQEIAAQVLADGQEQLSAAKNSWQEISVLLFNFKQLYKDHSRYLLFACDYKLFLVRNHLKLGRQEYEEILEPVRKIFLNALARGRKDGSISSKEDIEDQFFTIWGIARGYVEQIVVYDQMYDAENPWRERFDLVLQYTLEGLRNKD